MTPVTDDMRAAARRDAAIDDPDPDPVKRARWHRRTAIEMIISGMIGLLATVNISIEAWQIAGNPDVELGCDWNSVISCGTVARTWQAELLGFPNAFLGIAFETVVLTVSVAALGGVRFPRWFMLGTQLVYTGALFFAYWLFFQAYFVIGALCPWCVLIQITTTLVFAGLLRWNIRDGNIKLPGRAGPWAREFVAGGTDWYITGLVLVAYAVMVLVKYGPSLLG